MASVTSPRLSHFCMPTAIANTSIATDTFSCINSIDVGVCPLSTIGGSAGAVLARARVDTQTPRHPDRDSMTATNLGRRERESTTYSVVIDLCPASTKYTAEGRRSCDGEVRPQGATKIFTPPKTTTHVHVHVDGRLKHSQHSQEHWS